ncbi:MAG: hypothetical protein QOI66_3762 [Myxococcales bacterium]|jgi:hypothetical protein|nr:hypothetical protein [Myxococcales bacterium]
MKTPDGGADKPPTVDMGSVEMAETTPMDAEQEAVTPVRLDVNATALMLTEGSPTLGIKTFEVGLDRPWSTPITVTLISGNPNVALVTPETLEFAIGERAPKTVAVRAVEDDDTVDNSTTITISSLETGSKTVAVNVKDVDVQALLVFPTKVSMTEAGRTESVNVRLAKKPASAVVVTATPSNGAKLTVSPATLTFNSSNYNVEQTLTLTAPADLDAVSDKVTLDLSATGGVPPQQVAVDITDKDAVNLAISPGSLSIGEKDGTGDTLYVLLTLPPPGTVTVAVQSSNANKATVSPATLTFDASNWNTSQGVNVKGVADNDGRDENITVTFVASGITPVPDPKSVSVFIKDPDSQALQIAPSTIALQEGATATFTINLSLMPDGPVTLGVFSQNSSKIEVTPPLLSFTPQSYSVPQTVTVRSLQDDDLTNDTINVTLTGLGGQPINVPVSVTDDDHQQIQLILPTPGDTLTLPESRDSGPPSTAPLGVRLAFRPSAPTTVTIAGANAKLTVSRSTLTFSPGDFSTAQFVTLTAPRDQDMVNDQVDLTMSTPDVPSVKLPVTILDEDTQNFVIAETSLGPLKEGKQSQAEETATFTVKLKVAPAAPVTASITSNKPNKVSTDSATCLLNATNYTTGCVITVAAVEDFDTRDEAAIVTVADTAVGSAIAPRTVGVTVDDTDIQTLLVIDSPQPIGEGQSGSFTVKLAADPVDPVTVNVFSQSPDKLQVGAPILTFSSTTFDTPQTITLNAQQDDDVADESVKVTLTTLVADSATVTATITDDDTQAIILVPTTPGATFQMQEGTTSPIGVRLAFRPAATVTVALSVVRSPTSLASNVNLRVTPTTVTFGPGNSTGNFATTQFVTLNADPESDVVNELDLVTAKSTAIADATQAVLIIDKDVLNFNVTGAPSDPITEGGTTTFTVKLSAEPSSPVTPVINIDRPTKADVALDPPSCTLTTMASSCSVKVTAKQDDDARDDMVIVTVADMAAKITSRTVGVTIRDDDTQGLVLNAANPNPVVVSEKTASTPGKFKIKLAADPIDSVTIQLTPSLVGQIKFNDNGTLKTDMTFQFDTTGGANPWNVDKEFNVVGLEDLDLLEQNLSIRITLSGVLGVPDAFVNVRKTDDDKQELVLTDVPGGGCGSETERNPNDSEPTDADDLVTNAGTPMHVLEGNSKSFCVSLKFKPDTTNTVTLTPVQSPQPLRIASTTNFSVSPTPLTRIFTSDNYFKSQLVTISATPDVNLDDDPAQLSISVTPLAPAKTLFLLMEDDDEQTILIEKDNVAVPAPMVPVINLTEAAAGSSKNVSLGLKFAPTKETLNSTSSLEELTITPSSPKVTLLGSIGMAVGGGWLIPITDANFNSGLVTLTITAVQDADAQDENITLNITSSSHNVPATPARSISVKIADDDQALVFSPPAGIAINEGSTGSVGLNLLADPVADLVVSCTSNITKVSITDNPMTYTFTGGAGGNWMTPQNINLSANQDVDIVNDIATITCTTVGGLMETVSVTSDDDDGP